MQRRTHNNLTYYICHSFADQAWREPELDLATFVHVDVSRTKHNENINELGILEFLDNISWRDPAKHFYGLGHYRRWLDITTVDKLENGKAYVHIEPQPGKLIDIWAIYHSKEYLEKFFDLLREDDKALAEQIFAWMNNEEASKMFCARNLFIMPKASFMAWQKFMKNMRKLALKAKAKMPASPIWRDQYQKRQPGFLLERMTAFWLAEKSGLELVDTKMKELKMFSPYQRKLRTCLVAIQYEEKNLDEWARWHLDICKFDKIVLYNDRCEEHEFPEDLASRVIQRKALDELPNMGRQLVCYNDFLRKDITNYDIAMFLDLDEYLNLHDEDVEQFIWRKGQALVYGFNWVMFGSKILGTWPENSLAKRFRHRASRPDKHLKIVVDMRVLRLNIKLMPAFLNPHCLHSLAYKQIIPALAQDGTLVASPYAQTSMSPEDMPYVAHYYVKTEEEFKEKIARGRPDHPEAGAEQYFRQEEKMWETRREYDRSEVYDDEIASKLSK